MVVIGAATRVYADSIFFDRCMRAAVTLYRAQRTHALMTEQPFFPFLGALEA
jgi:hypothetical protein